MATKKNFPLELNKVKKFWNKLPQAWKKALGKMPAPKIYPIGEKLLKPLAQKHKTRLSTTR